MNQPKTIRAVSSVGAKCEIAQAVGIFSTIGEDLIAKLSDQMIADGVTPESISQFVISGEVRSEYFPAIFSALKKGSIKAGLALSGGVEDFAFLAGDKVDLAGSITGSSRGNFQHSPESVREGDLIIAMPASGFHLSGLSLVQEIIATQELDLSNSFDFSKSLGEVLLTPSEIYTLDCLALLKSQGENIRAFSYISDGGLALSTAISLPDGLSAIYDRSTWSLPAEMTFLGDLASLSQVEIENNWNSGIGMSAIVDAGVGDLIVRSLAARGMKAWIAGKVEKAREKGAPRSYLVSEYQR